MVVLDEERGFSPASHAASDGGAKAPPYISDPHIPDADGFYAAWLRAHEGLNDAQSADLNARLVLLLANQCGDQRVLLSCIAAASQGSRA